jgi:hypothetical protein
MRRNTVSGAVRFCSLRQHRVADALGIGAADPMRLQRIMLVWRHGLTLFR